MIALNILMNRKLDSWKLIALNILLTI